MFGLEQCSQVLSGKTVANPIDEYPATMNKKEITTLIIMVVVHAFIHF